MTGDGNVFHGEVRIRGNHNAIVSGTGNTVGSTGADPFAELERLIAQHDNEIPDSEAASSAAAALREEADSDRPNTGLRRALLAGLTAAVGPVTAVAEAIGKVRQALGL